MPDQFLRRDERGHWICNLRGHPGDMLATLLSHVPDIAIAIRENRLIPGKVDLYQVGMLYMCARQYSYPGAQIVDFGTMHGWSASMLSAGAPEATIHTLEPDKARRVKAKQHLQEHHLLQRRNGNGGNIRVLAATSEVFQKDVQARGVGVDLVFVDGDHHHCELDMPWWDLLKSPSSSGGSQPGGLMLFHDYTDKYMSVVNCVNELVARLGKERPDILLVNAQNGQGLAGVYKV